MHYRYLVALVLSSVGVVLGTENNFTRENGQFVNTSGIDSLVTFDAPPLLPSDILSLVSEASAAAASLTGVVGSVVFSIAAQASSHIAPVHSQLSSPDLSNSDAYLSAVAALESAAASGTAAAVSYIASLPSALDGALQAAASSLDFGASQMVSGGETSGASVTGPGLLLSGLGILSVLAVTLAL